MSKKVICINCGAEINLRGSLVEYCENCGEAFYAEDDFEEDDEYTPKKEKIKSKKPKRSQW